MDTIKLFHPEDLDLFGDGFVHEAVEGHEEDFEVNFTYLYSIGWSDSDDESNDKALDKITELLCKDSGEELYCAHPESREPGKLLKYKGYSIFVTTGPNIFASGAALRLLAKDAGVKIERWEKK